VRQCQLRRTPSPRSFAVLARPPETWCGHGAFYIVGRTQQGVCSLVPCMMYLVSTGRRPRCDNKGVRAPVPSGRSSALARFLFVPHFRRSFRPPVPTPLRFLCLYSPAIPSHLSSTPRWSTPLASVMTRTLVALLALVTLATAASNACATSHTVKSGDVSGLLSAERDCKADRPAIASSLATPTPTPLTSSSTLPSSD
jgi:hypothetical protein